MQIYQKQLIDFFSSLVHQNFDAYCNRHAIPKNNNSFLNFLFTQDLMSETAIRRYTIDSEYSTLKQQNEELTKSQLVRLLADKYNLTDRTIWNIIQTKSIKKTKAII